MKKHNLAFIDLETTGLNPSLHEIIEIGCIIAKQIERDGAGPELQKIEEFDMKVKPENIENAERGALRISGYEESEWLFALNLEQAMKQLNDKVKDAIMVGHNVSFDWAFLEKAFLKTGMESNMHYHKLDTISFAYAKLYDKSDIQRFSLKSLCDYFGVKNEKAHTALSDIRATFEVYQKLIEIK